MIDRIHALPILRQCQILALSRSTAYSQPQPISATELALRRRINTLHLAYPFAGARMLRDRAQASAHPDDARRASRPCIASPTPASGIQPTRSIPICCAIWRSLARITSGRRTSVRHLGEVGDTPTTLAGCRPAAGMLPRSGRTPSEGGCTAPLCAESGVSYAEQPELYRAWATPHEPGYHRV